MESKKINQLATELAPELSDLTIIGDPTTGISKKITLSQMASLFTGTVEEYPNLAAFPLVGVADTIYIALDTNVLYRWDTTLTSYVELSPNIINSLVFNDANGFDGTISLVGSVATLTITTALTTGSVGFIGASGALTQDNSNFYWDNSNKRLGINTNAPTTAIDVFGSDIIGRLNGTSTNNAFLGFASAGSNKWSIGNVQSDHRFRIYSEATTSELVSVLQTGEFGIGIANPLTKLHIFGGASALIANLDANTSVAKSISFRSGNSSRINLEVSGTESGSNAGANFYLRTYTDAGSLLATPLTITRSTGAIDLSGALTGTSGIFSSTLTATQMTLNTFSSGRNLRLSSNPTGIEFYNTVGLVRNWQISAQSINDQSLDFTPSTTNGGTTYSTPLLSLQGVSSRATITGDLLVKKSGAPQLTLSIDGTTGLFFRDGTNAAWKSWQIATSYNDGSDLSFIPSTNTSGTPTWGSTAMVIQGNGRVGIGNTSPNRALEITTTNTPPLRITTTAGNTGIEFLTSSGTYNWRIGGQLSANNFFEITPSTTTGGTTFNNPAFGISSSGNIGIGNTGLSGQRVRINSETNDTTSYAFVLCSANGTDLFNVRSDNAMNLGQLSTNFTTASAANLYVNPSNGFVYRSTSSLKYKKNIQDYAKGLSEILQLRAVTYNSKSESDEGKTFVGLIAEEVHDLGLTEFVQYAENGSPDALYYQNMVAILIKGIQELKLELDILKAK